MPITDLSRFTDLDVSRPYAYTLYGMHIHSAMSLPLLAAPARQEPALTITFVPAAARPTLADATLHYAYPYVNAQGESLLQILRMEQADACYYWLHMWADDAWLDSLVREDGRAVLAVEDECGAHEKSTPLVLGITMSLALRLQGATCLHASAVLTGGGVVAFTGQSTTGKSTTLTALMRHGADFFSDDLVPLRTLQAQSGQDQTALEQFVAFAGYARVGLWPDAMSALFGPKADLPTLEVSDKRMYTPAITYDAAQPWPVRGIYILSPRGTDPSLVEPQVVPLSQMEAVAELMPHTTGRTLRTELGHVNDLARIAALARAVPVRRVDRPNDLSQLDAVAQAILQDVRSLPKVEHMSR